MKTVYSFSFFFLLGLFILLIAYSLSNSSYVSTAVNFAIIYLRDCPNQHLAKRVEIVNTYSGTMLTVLLTTMCGINKVVRDVSDYINKKKHYKKHMVLRRVFSN